MGTGDQELVIGREQNDPQEDQRTIVDRPPSSCASDRCSCSPTTQGEYLIWAKQRAVEYLLRGELRTSFAVMVSDLGRHGQLKNHPNIEVGFGELDQLLQDPDKMHQWLDGFDEKWKSTVPARMREYCDQVQKAMGRRIMKLRRNTGVSRKVLAERAGMSLIRIQEIERGRVDFDLSAIVTIAKVFDIPLTRLFDRIA